MTMPLHHAITENIVKNYTKREINNNKQCVLLFTKYN